MGILCCVDPRDSDGQVETLSQEHQQAPSDTKLPGKGGSPDEESAAEDLVANADEFVLAPKIGDALEVPENVRREIRKTARRAPASASNRFAIDPALWEESAAVAKEKLRGYEAWVEQATLDEASLGFEFACKQNATPIEVQADQVLQRLKRNDIARFYEKAPKRRGYRGQEHARFYGDHFLSNLGLIGQTQLFALCQAMPKGAHLHIHFNANLEPHFLLDIAKGMDRMFIWSDGILNNADAFHRCKIHFSIMNETAVEERGVANLFEEGYEPGRVMQFRDFREKFPGGDEAADRWLESKLVFDEGEAHSLLQTPEGAWEKFNARTQMMKGLFNYETAYTKYTRACLEEFVADNIQYAEIRPNFMKTNQVWKDDGSSQIDNVGIMDLIIEAYEAFQVEHQRRVLKGLKVIYCTPRSFPEAEVEKSLWECLRFKAAAEYKRFSSYIAGFDLVGEESKGKPLKAFRQQFIQFQTACQALGVEIPFLFHCGETLDVGTGTDGNLMHALALGAKRIGHGFALPRHPLVMDKMKQRNVCVEVCPISNEILGLTPRVSGHAVYNLLANNVPCTISTDNGTLFRSRLSHDFYQVLAGKSDLSLHGLRQLCQWSLEHSCMEPELKREVRADWERMWDGFCHRIVRGDFTLEDDDSGAAETDDAEARVDLNRPPGGLPPA